MTKSKDFFEFLMIIYLSMVIFIRKNCPNAMFHKWLNSVSKKIYRRIINYWNLPIVDLVNFSGIPTVSNVRSHKKIALDTQNKCLLNMSSFFSIFIGLHCIETLVCTYIYIYYLDLDICIFLYVLYNFLSAIWKCIYIIINIILLIFSMKFYKI